MLTASLVIHGSAVADPAASEIAPSQEALDLAAEGGAAIDDDGSDDQQDRVIIRTNANGTVRWLHGGGFELPVADAGCPADDPATSAACFLDFHGHLFGAGSVGTELSFDRSRTLQSGHTMVFFRQVHRGIPIHGSSIVLTLSPTGAVTSVFSTLLTFFPLPVASPGLDAASAIDETQLTLDVGQLYEVSNPSLKALQDIWYVDPKAPEAPARRARRYRLLGGAGNRSQQHLIVDVETRHVLSSEPIATNVYQRAKLFASAHHPEINPSTDCFSDFNCIAPLTCNRVEYHKPNNSGVCTRPCTADNECPTGWRCEVTPGSMIVGYCAGFQGDADGYDLAYDTLYVDPWYPSASWYRHHWAYQREAEALHDTVVWHQDYLGVTGTDFPIPYRMNSESLCDRSDDGDNLWTYA